MESEQMHLTAQSDAGRDPSIVERVADWFSGGVIYAMVIFSPWAFGTTQEWSIKVMNWAGYALGVLLLLKWVLRKIEIRRRREKTTKAQRHKGKDGTGRDGIGAGLFCLTILFLLYCAVSAWNARATYSYVDSTFDYHDYISWLPHSYDSLRSWDLFWNYLALACSFWAVRDWLQNEDHSTPSAGNPLFSRRWKKLLWIICINGALLGAEGIVQRADNSGKLLWLVQPRIHKDAASQFGPYAYRSNGAQYLNLVWPTAIALWWSLQQSVRRSQRKRTAHHLLFPAAMIMAAGAIISLSRGGILEAVGQIGLMLLLLLIARRQSSWRAKIGFILIGLITAMLAVYVNWAELTTRFKTIATDQLSGRVRIYAIAKQMIRDYPLFGTGPNTFDPVSQLYLESTDASWIVQVHNDWLETLATFGFLGSSLIWLALALVAAAPFLQRDGIRNRGLFVAFLWVALGGTLIHGAFDFPFQIYSILFLFLVLCALVSAVSVRRR